jgi:hypothetical protein
VCPLTAHRRTVDDRALPRLTRPRAGSVGSTRQAKRSRSSAGKHSRVLGSGGGVLASPDRALARLSDLNAGSRGRPWRGRAMTANARGPRPSRGACARYRETQLPQRGRRSGGRPIVSHTARLTQTLPFSPTIGRGVAAPTARIAACGRLTTAVKCATLSPEVGRRERAAEDSIGCRSPLSPGGFCA